MRSRWLTGRSAPRSPGIPAGGRSRPSPGSGRCWGRCSSPRSTTCKRFPTARHLCSWAGLTPSHRESDTTVVKGHITKQGSRLVRWAAVEAAQKTGDFLKTDYRRIAERRNNRKIARVAVARKIVTLVYCRSASRCRAVQVTDRQRRTYGGSIGPVFCDAFRGNRGAPLSAHRASGSSAGGALLWRGGADLVVRGRARTVGAGPRLPISPTSPG